MYGDQAVDQGQREHQPIRSRRTPDDGAVGRRYDGEEEAEAEVEEIGTGIDIGTGIGTGIGIGIGTGRDRRS